MNLAAARRYWDRHANTDPMWAILTASDKRGGGWRTEEFFATGVAEVAYLMERTARWGRPLGRQRALDFGCGIGRITQPLGAYFEKVYGVDISQAMLDLARRHNRKGDRCEYEWIDGADLRRFANDSFDLIYSRLTLQHIRPREVRSYLKEFLRLLSPGGLLYFQYPSRALRAQFEFRLARIGRRLLQTQSPMYMNGMNRNKVVAWLERHGGTIVEIEDDQAAGAKYAGYAYAVTI